MILENTKILEDGTVEGTLKKIENFTDFSSEVSEQNGYYLPIKLTISGTKMTFKKNNVETKKNINFDQDIIFRVTKNDIFEIIVDENSIVKLNFAKANFEE